MSEGKTVGISTTTFVAGLLIAILISSVASTLVYTQIVGEGPKGDKGDTGSRGSTGPQGTQGLTGPQGEKGDTGSQGLQGLQGIQGERGPSGGIEADVTTSLTSTFHEVWGGLDYHIVEGLVINFGKEKAYNVVLTLTWGLYTGGTYTDSDSIGTMDGHEIIEYSQRFDFEGSYDYITSEITWT